VGFRCDVIGDLATLCAGATPVAGAVVNWQGT
jgi:hypothetical protein